MNLLVIDPDWPAQPRKRDWTSMLGRQIVPNPSLPCHAVPPGVVFIHFRFSVADLTKFADDHSECVVIVISGDVKDSSWKDTARRYWRNKPVRKPDDLEFSQCAQAFLEAFHVSGKPNFALLEPERDEARLALCLLCEAWLMNRDTTDEGKVNAAQDHNGIIVNAPITPDDWFDPFVEGFKALEDASKKKAAETAMRNIAAQMGDANTRADVDAFLKNLAKLYAGSGKPVVARLGFEVIIEKLVKKLKSTEAR